MVRHVPGLDVAGHGAIPRRVTKGRARQDAPQPGPCEMTREWRLTCTRTTSIRRPPRCRR
jgi:hypothetical protein